MMNSKTNQSVVQMQAKIPYCLACEASILTYSYLIRDSGKIATAIISRIRRPVTFKVHSWSYIVCYHFQTFHIVIRSSLAMLR